MSDHNLKVSLLFMLKPKALQRHRTVTKGKRTWQYDPSKQDKAMIIAYVKSKYADCINMFDENDVLSFQLTAGIKRPKSHYVSNCVARGLKKSAPSITNCKNYPDLSNVVKLYEDAFNKLIFPDDKNIAKISANKLWVESLEYVLVHIEKIKPPIERNDENE